MGKYIHQQIIAGVLLAGFVFVICFILNSQKYNLVLMYFKTEIADLEQNGTPQTITLENGVVRIVETGRIFWQSPLEWHVLDFAIGDVTGDGRLDLVLSLWKRGDFGSSRPFWVTQNDMSSKNHLFVLDFVDGKMRPVWESSNLGVPNCEIKIQKDPTINQDALFVVEGEYFPVPICKGEYHALWKWNGWGFSNEWRESLPQIIPIPALFLVQS